MRRIQVVAFSNRGALFWSPCASPAGSMGGAAFLGRGGGPLIAVAG